MGLQTVVLKLHKPGKAKQAAMDGALASYNAALRFLLGQACSNPDQFDQSFKEKGGTYNVLALSKWIGRDISGELNQYGVQPFKDSLRLEFGAALADCLRLRDTGSGRSLRMPECWRKEEGKLRPLYFCRYDTKRSYCLLYDKSKDRYYAKLYLFNAAGARPVPEHPACTEKLVHLHKDNRVLERNGRKEAFIVVPLAFGQWQEKILKAAAISPQRFRTARLYKKKGDYYLSIAIETLETENIKTAAFLGVSRGLKSGLNYAVAGPGGTIQDFGPLPAAAAGGNAQGVCLNELHEAANLICDMAVHYKAQVIVQNLTDKGDKLGWLAEGEEQYRPRYRWKDYNRFTRLLEYKLGWRGLPKLARVSSIGIFYTCPHCGLNTIKNRFSKDLFICTGCGATMAIDKLGSVNLAKKLISYRASKIKVSTAATGEGILFTNKILGLECFVSPGENHLGRLKEEIDKIIEASKEASGTSRENGQYKRISLVRKLRSAENIMDLVEYI